MTKFGSRHPIVFSLLAIILIIIVIKLLDIGLVYLKLSALATRIIIEAVFCGYVVLLLTRLAWWREAGFKQPLTSRKLLAYLPLLFLPIAVPILSGFKVASAGQTIQFAIFVLMVGFAEEGLLRGFALRAMLPSGLMRAALLSSLFFGIGHLINVWQGASLPATIIQVIYTILLSIGFAGARLFTGTIWPAIVVHALIDFTDAASRGFVLAPPRSLTLASVIAPIVITGLYALYGLWLLRRTPI